MAKFKNQKAKFKITIQTTIYMSRFKKIIIFALIALIVVFVVWLITRNQPKAPGSNQMAVPVDSLDNQAVVPTGVPVAQAVDPFASIEAIARSFAERFGSFSNQSNFENITDLRPFMTDKMRDWAENYIAQIQAKRIDMVSYTGTTTRALSSKIIAQNKNSATVSVMTTRRESTTSPSSDKIYQQNLELRLVRENGIWKVDQAEWQ